MSDREKSIQFKGFTFEWLGQSTVRITSPAGYVIYTDPVLLDPGAPEAGLILVTHHHVDHCLPEFITPIRGAKTKVAAFHASYLKYCVQDIKGVRTIKIGETVDFNDASVTGVEAYTPRGFHSKGEGCGFLIDIEGLRIYFSGDTARTPEMDALKGVDVAIVSICDNTYTIDAKEMAEAVRALSAGLFIPVHFTPADEPEPEIGGDMILYSKDPKFFTKKEDPATLLPVFEGTGTVVAMLEKLGKSITQKD